MLTSKPDPLIMFQPPTREILQQKDIHETAQKYYDFFGFTDSALIFLKRYLTENFGFLKYFDKTSSLLNQACHKFYASWPKLHYDPSPLISVLLVQLENIESLACSLSPLEFKAEEEVHEGFSKKINSIKTIQQTIDKNFQSLWKQCHNKTSTYYQKLEDYKEQTDKVRHKYEKYEKQTRDSKAYNVTLVKKLEEKLNKKVEVLRKTKDAFDKISSEAQESYQAVLKFFDSNKAPIEEFIRLFLITLVEMSMFVLERVQENFAYMRQTTLEILQKLKALDFKGSWEEEDGFIKKFSQDEHQNLGYIKEMNRVNHHRQEFLNSMGSLFQESMRLCQEMIEKFVYFEEVNTFEAFFCHFDRKISFNLLPFVTFFKEMKQIFIGFFSHEKGDSEQIIRKLASQRSVAYSSLTNAFSKTLNNSTISSPLRVSAINLETSPGLNEAFGGEIQKAVTDFLQIEETLSKELIKDLERLYNSMVQGMWNKGIQVCQKNLLEFQENIREDKLDVEVKRIYLNLSREESILQIETSPLQPNQIKSLSTNHNHSQIEIEEDIEHVANEREAADIQHVKKLSQNEFKFMKEKKAESLLGFLKRQNEEKLKEINPNPYTVDFENSKISLSAPNDSVLGSFSCAFVDNMLLQGRIYLTKTRLVFKSYFNGRTLFGQTVLFIPLEDIINVKKKKNLFGIENMIEVTTKKGNIEFTSFVFRDKAFEMIEQVLNTLHPEYTKSPNKFKRSINPADALDEIADNLMEDGGTNAGNKKLRRQQKREMEYQRRNKAIIKAIPSLKQYDQLAYSYKFEVDYNTFFKTLLCKLPIEYKGKSYSCFWEAIENAQGSFEIKLDDWSQEPPKDITKKRDLLPFKNIVQRKCYGLKNLNMPVPLVPKSVRFYENHRLAFLNENQVLMYLELISLDKIPLGDAFMFHTVYIIKNETGQDGKPLVSLSLKYYLEWYYDTIFKKVIFKSCIDEISRSGTIFDKVIRELIADGVFEKKRQELAAQNQTEDSVDDDGDDHEGDENDINNEQEDMDEAKDQVEEILSDKKAITNKSTSEFKVSKRVLLLYFSVSLILFSYIFMKHFLR